MFGIRIIKEIIVEMIADNRWILCQILFAGYMVALSAEDIRKKRLPLLFLLSGTVFIIIQGFCVREISMISLMAGGAVGALFLLISRMTRESFGYGDSILILVMGMFLGFGNIIYLLMGAFSMAAVFSIVMLIKTQFSRKSAFPFVPFLAAAYIGGMLLGNY